MDKRHCVCFRLLSFHNSEIVGNIYIFYTYIYIYMHIYIHTYIYTYIYIYIHYIYIYCTHICHTTSILCNADTSFTLSYTILQCVCTYIYIYTLSYIYSHAIWLLTTGMSTCVYSPYHMIAVHNSRGLEKPIQIHDIILHLIIYIHDYMKICMYCILWRLRTVNIKWYQFTSCFGAHQENKA